MEMKRVGIDGDRRDETCVQWVDVHTHACLLMRVKVLFDTQALRGGPREKMSLCSSGA